MLHVHFAPVKHKAQWGRLISSLTWFDWSHKYWRLPTTKVLVRGLILSGVRNLTWRANLAPPWVGEEYSLTYIVLHSNYRSKIDSQLFANDMLKVYGKWYGWKYRSKKSFSFFFFLKKKLVFLAFFICLIFGFFSVFFFKTKNQKKQKLLNLEVF